VYKFSFGAISAFLFILLFGNSQAFSQQKGTCFFEQKNICDIHLSDGSTIDLKSDPSDKLQEQINNDVNHSKLSHRTMVEIGRQLFSNPFSLVDGYGEGAKENAEGPRMKWLRLARLVKNDEDDTNNTNDKDDDVGNFAKNFPMGISYLRLNGLDSQSCFECHNSIGSHTRADTASSALTRKVDVNGGPAGFASTAFINPTMQCNDAEPGDASRNEKSNVFVDNACFLPGFLFEGVDPGAQAEIDKISKKWRNSAFMFFRNPPHVFGTGYAQKISEEMSLDLHRIRLAAMLKAIGTGTAQVRDLVSKSVHFGTYTVEVTPVDAAVESFRFRKMAGPGFGDFIKFLPVGDIGIVGDYFVNESCTVRGVRTEGKRYTKNPDASSKEKFVESKENECRLDGVSRDLIVRPFQWKGIASDERNFVRDALNFHFGLEAKEIKSEDQDKDGIKNEMSIGGVSLLTVFTMSIRPPEQVWPEDELARLSAERGQEVFRGAGPLDSTACASCHRESLVIKNTSITVRDPRMDGDAIKVASNTSLSSQLEHVDGTPLMLREAAAGVKIILQEAVESGEMLDQYKLLEERLKDFLSGEKFEKVGYTFDLTLGEGTPNKQSLSLSYPRLQENLDGSVTIPIFTDFKRHNMGEGLTDPASQEVDRKGIPLVPAAEFMTRPLWGVADTGPWMHDGRAQTLKDAIKAHMSVGSEANDAVIRFNGLEEAEQKDLINFLLTMRLPEDRLHTSNK